MTAPAPELTEAATALLDAPRQRQVTSVTWRRRARAVLTSHTKARGEAAKRWLHPSRYIRQMSFLAVGAACLILQLATLVVLIRLHVDRNVANGVSFLIGAEVKFVLSRHLVWPDRLTAGGTWQQLAWFNVTTVVVFVADTIVFASTAWLLTAIPGAMLGVGAGTAASYVVCDRVVFRARRHPPGDGDRSQTALDAFLSDSLRRQNGHAELSNPIARNAHIDSRLWLVVPAYNEVRRLGGTIEQYGMAIAARDRLVIVVNGSSDGTESVARRAAAEDARLRVLIDKRKIGKGGALLAGYRFVSAHAETSDVVCYVDADAAISGAEIVRFCGDVAPGELRVGSRWCDTTSQLRRQPVVRQIASRVFNRYVRVALPLDLKDTQCGAKAMCAGSLLDVISRLDSNGFAFDLDLILSAHAAGLAIREVPVLWADQDGSTVSMRKAVPAMLSEVLRLRRKYRSLPKPASTGLAITEGPTPAWTGNGQAEAAR